MTRPHRRDQYTKNASVITGLRCEAELAQKLCDYARENVRADLTQPASRTNPGNVSEAARYLLRRGVGMTHEHAVRVEVVERKANAGIPGLQLDDDTSKRLRAWERTVGLGRFSTARHLLRIGLGISKKESLRREEHFIRIAEAKREVMSADE